MVARTPPPRQRKIMAPPLNPLLLRETVMKVEKCMARLQELQYTVTGGSKVIAGVTLSPRSTRGYLKASLRCKQESLRMKNSASKKSPPGKFPGSKSEGEWRRMSLPAMLVGETVGEILQASQFAREIVEAVSNKTKNKIVLEDPKTPILLKQKPNLENSELRVRRKREKRALQPIRGESNAPSAQRAKSRINFKVSPPKKAEMDKDKENQRYTANRISPKHRPWAKKTVLFPNPLFISTPSKQQHKFSKTRSPIIPRNRQTPHKFLIKTPPAKNKSPMLASTSKFQVKIKSPPLSISPTRAITISKKSPKMSKLRRSLSPARLANRLMSPMKSRKAVQKYDVPMCGLKQRPSPSPMRFLIRRI